MCMAQTEALAGVVWATFCFQAADRVAKVLGGSRLQMECQGLYVAQHLQPWASGRLSLSAVGGP